MGRTRSGRGNCQNYRDLTVAERNLLNRQTFDGRPDVLLNYLLKPVTMESCTVHAFVNAIRKMGFPAFGDPVDNLAAVRICHCGNVFGDLPSLPLCDIDGARSLVLKSEGLRHLPRNEVLQVVSRL